MKVLILFHCRSGCMQGRNHVFKVGGPIPWSRVLLPFYRKNRQVYPVWCSRLHNHTLFFEKLCKKLGRPSKFWGGPAPVPPSGCADGCMVVCVVRSVDGWPRSDSDDAGARRGAWAWSRRRSTELIQHAHGHAQVRFGNSSTSDQNLRHSYHPLVHLHLVSWCSVLVPRLSILPTLWHIGNGSVPKHLAQCWF